MLLKWVWLSPFYYEEVNANVSCSQSTVHEVKAVLLKILKCQLPFSLYCLLHGSRQAMVIKLLAPSHKTHSSSTTLVVTVFSTHSLKQVCFTLDEAVEIINFNLNSWIHILLIFLAMAWEVHTEHFSSAHPSTMMASRKSTYKIVWIMTWINCFFHEISYYLKKILSNPTIVIQIWVFNIFSKINEAYHFKENIW